MRDVAYVAVVVGFFGACAAYVRACARIVGGTAVDAVPGDAVPGEPGGTEDRAEAAR